MDSSCNNESECMKQIMKQLLNSNDMDENELCNKSMDKKQLQDVELELSKLKGDAIGDTLYSSSWIIRNLMSLTQVTETGWSEELENQLCLLWDMSAEKDVTLFLMEHEFLSIIKPLLNVTSQPRMIEIIIGILGNMVTCDSVVEKIGHDFPLVEGILNTIFVTDSPSLIQLLRFLQVIAVDIRKNSPSIWLDHLRNFQHLGNVINYILKNSTNDELLIATTNFLYFLTWICAPQSLLQILFKIPDLTPALLEAFIQFVPEGRTICCQNSTKTIESWLAIFRNITKVELVTTINDNNKIYINLIEVLSRILKPYKESNIISIDDQNVVVIQECVDIVKWLQFNKLNIEPVINEIILTILCNLKTGINQKLDENKPDSEHTIDQLFQCLKEYWLQCIQLFTVENITEILRLCTHSTRIEFSEILQCLKKAEPEKCEEIQSIISSFQQD